MTDFKDTLNAMDPELMHEVVLNHGLRIGSPDGEDVLSKLIEYPAFATILPLLQERFDKNPNLSPREKNSLLLGVMTCLEVFADYADSEELNSQFRSE